MLKGLTLFSFQNIFDFDIQNDNTYNYLFHAEWRKNFVDTDLHNYDGFSNVLRTANGQVINTGNYHIGNHELFELDKQMSKFFGTFVESHFINILPNTEVGSHYDVYDAEDETVNAVADDFINTSILFPVYGNIEVESNGHIRKLENDRFTVIDTSKLHNGWNKDKKLSYCFSSLVYGKTYKQIKKQVKEYIIEDLDV